MENYPEMRGKWDLAKLPKCADPIEDSESLDQDGRATMSNGLCYSTSARGKNREAALDVIKFLVRKRHSGSREKMVLLSLLILAVKRPGAPHLIPTMKSWIWMLFSISSIMRCRPFIILPARNGRAR